MKSGFVTRPPFRWVEGKRLGQLTDDLVYQDEVFGPVMAQRNFETDFGTIPRFLWPIDSTIEHDIVYPSALHDFLYFTKADGNFSRKEADDIFYRAMLDENAPKWKALGRYWAVRMFAGFNGGWKKR